MGSRLLRAHHSSLRSPSCSKRAARHDLCPSTDALDPAIADPCTPDGGACVLIAPCMISAGASQSAVCPDAAPVADPHTMALPQVRARESAAEADSLVATRSQVPIAQFSTALPPQITSAPPTRQPVKPASLRSSPLAAPVSGHMSFLEASSRSRRIRDSLTPCASLNNRRPCVTVLNHRDARPPLPCLPPGSSAGQHGVCAGALAAADAAALW